MARGVPGSRAVFTDGGSDGPALPFRLGALPAAATMRP
jgi:hypothetical protein